MPGGIVQLVNYGSEDIYLTASPQITYFKIVYRRYNNFAIESIKQHFIGIPNFGHEMSCVVDKIGDLMYRTYLEIDLPSVALLKNPTYCITDLQRAKSQFTAINACYTSLCEYISVNTMITRKLHLLLITNNINMHEITVIMSRPDVIEPLLIKRNILQKCIIDNDLCELNNCKSDLIQQLNRIDIKLLFDAVRCEECLAKRNLLHMINRQLYHEMKHFYMQFYNVFLEHQLLVDALITGCYVERYKYAWVEEVGHAIIDTIDLRIGNQLVDRHTGDWLTLFNQLYLSEYQRENYNRMIGNVPELTVFNDCVKDCYKLTLPLQFWYCRYNGLALPLVALKYHDVVFNIKLKDLSKLCYVEDSPQLLDIPNIQTLYNINIPGARLYIDYVFLDTTERAKFAQSTHEYLIEVVQYNEYPDLVYTSYNANLTFFHPTKYIVWFVQPNWYRANPTGRNKCQWNNFGIQSDKTGYPIASQFIRLNSYDLVDTSHPIIYYNYVQPYLHFRNSPTDGVNVYSFSLKPMEHQPSATCNFSRIDNLSISMKFTPPFLDLMNCNPDIWKGFYFAAYAVSYNILRIMGGMAGLAFQTAV